MPCIRLLEVNRNRTFVRAPPFFSELFPGLRLTSTYLPMTQLTGVAHTRFRSMPASLLIVIAMRTGMMKKMMLSELSEEQSAGKRGQTKTPN